MSQKHRKITLPIMTINLLIGEKRARLTHKAGAKRIHHDDRRGEARTPVGWRRARAGPGVSGGGRGPGPAGEERRGALRLREASMEPPRRFVEFKGAPRS